jgi:hypothetical protein
MELDKMQPAKSVSFGQTTVLNPSFNSSLNPSPNPSLNLSLNSSPNLSLNSSPNLSLNSSPNPSFNPSYESIAKDFVSKYSLSSNLGFVNSYFDSNVMCTLHIRHPQNPEVYEMTGYANLQTKLSNMGIQKFKYENYVQSSQPVLNDVLTTVLGQININEQLHSFESVFILRKIGMSYLAVNYILQIFI